MNILYYFNDFSTVMFQWQQYHIVEEMHTHECEIEILSPLKYLSIDIANDAILEKLKTGKYKIFMSCLTEKEIRRETLVKAKTMGVKTLLFCPDNLVVPYNHQKLAPLFDLVWLTSKETEYLFKKWGCTTIFLPYAANPNFLKPDWGQKKIQRVGFIGTPHGSRIHTINILLKNRIPVTIHTSAKSVETHLMQASAKDYLKVLFPMLSFPIGRRLAVAAFKDKLFKRRIQDPYGMLEIKGPVPLNQLGKLNSSYALVLAFADANSSGVLANPVDIVNLRNFEIPMSGCVEFVRYTEELAEYFSDEKEIILYRNNDDMVEKARKYLEVNSQSKLIEIGNAARSRAEKDHTWYCRFQKVFQMFGFF